MPFRPAQLDRQRFGIVRIAAGAFDDLAALDLPETLSAVALLRSAEERVGVLAEQLRDEAFAAIGGCDDARLRRQLLAAKRDLFNGRRIDASSLALPHAAQYEAAVAARDGLQERFTRTFEREVAAAREKLHALAQSEALQRPLALSSLTLLAEIRKRITPHTERALMKYVGRMHAKTSPFSTFCHIAPATFAPLAQGVMCARLGAATVTRQANRVAAAREEERYFEDSVLGGKVVCDERAIDALTDTMSSYVLALSFSDPAIARRRELRRWFGGRVVVPLSEILGQWPSAPDDDVKRWTNELASRLEVTGDCIHIDRQHVDRDGEPPRSFAAMVQFIRGGAVLNGLGPGYGKQVSRFLDLLPPDVLDEQRAVNRRAAGRSRFVEVNDGSLLNMNIHPQLVDGEIGESDVPDLVVKVGDDDTLWLWHVPTNQRIEVVDLGLQDPATRSPLHRFLNTFFSPAQELIRRPLLRAALAASGPTIARPRVIYDRRLVIRRKTWEIPKAMLPARAKGESDAAFFRRVDDWRVSLRMPAYVVVKIRRTAKRDDRKPQFISFASWHSVALLEKLFDRVVDILRAQEMLPAPDDMLEWNGRRHAIEFVVHWNRSE
jgi:Lantibiotic dehydratase, N terminus